MSEHPENSDLNKSLNLLPSPETKPFTKLLCKQTNPGGYKSIRDERAPSEFSFCHRKRERGWEGLSKKQDKCLIFCASYIAEEAAELQKDVLTDFVDNSVVWFVGSCSNDRLRLSQVYCSLLKNFKILTN